MKRRIPCMGRFSSSDEHYVHRRFNRTVVSANRLPQPALYTISSHRISDLSTHRQSEPTRRTGRGLDHHQQTVRTQSPASLLNSSKIGPLPKSNRLRKTTPVPRSQHGPARLRLLAADGDNQALAALGTTRRDDLPAGRGGLASPKAMGPFALDVVWLVRPLESSGIAGSCP